MKRRTTTARVNKRIAVKSAAKGKAAKKSVNPENYSDVTISLQERLKTRAPVNYERGRDRMRQHLVDALELTPTRARHIVSALVQKGYVRFGPHPNYRHDHTVGCWTYHPNTDR